MTTVTGQVRDPAGQPVTGARLTLRLQGWPDRLWRATSTACGAVRFELPPVSPKRAGWMTVAVEGSDARTSLRLGQQFALETPPPEVWQPGPRRERHPGALLAGTPTLGADEPRWGLPRGSGGVPGGKSVQQMEEEAAYAACFQCGQLAATPEECYPRGTSAASPPGFPVERVQALFFAAKAKVDKLHGAAQMPGSERDVWAEYRISVDTIVAAWLATYEQWLDAPRCVKCLEDRALMEKWVAEDAAAWLWTGTPVAYAYKKNTPAVPGNGIGWAPPAIAKGAWGKENQFPSILWSAGDYNLAAGKSSQLGNGPLLVAVRRTPLLEQVVSRRAWRALPEASARRFWARLFGDVCWCGIYCRRYENTDFANESLGTTFPKFGGGSLDLIGPPIPYAFGIPPWWYSKEVLDPDPFNPDPYASTYCSNSKVNYTHLYGKEPSQLGKSGKPKEQGSAAYKNLNLYVVAVPVAFEAIGRVLVDEPVVCSASSVAPPAACSCWLVKPKDLVSPDGQKQNDFLALAQSELPKWAWCGSGDCE